MAQRKVSSRKISQLFQLTCSDKVPMSNMNPGPASTPILSETKKHISPKSMGLTSVSRTGYIYSSNGTLGKNHHLPWTIDHRLPYMLLQDLLELVEGLSCWTKFWCTFGLESWIKGKWLEMIETNSIGKPTTRNSRAVSFVISSNSIQQLTHVQSKNSTSTLHIRSRPSIDIHWFTTPSQSTEITGNSCPTLCLGEVIIFRFFDAIKALGSARGSF